MHNMGTRHLSGASAYDWCYKFSEDHEQVANWPHGYLQPTDDTDVSVRRTEKLILEKRGIKVRDIASKVFTSADSVQTTICEHLSFNKVCARWVPQKLSFDQKTQRVSVSVGNLNQPELQADAFVKRILTCGEMWVYCFTPELKRSYLERRYKESPPPKEFETQLSAGKIMSRVFYDTESIIIWVYYHLEQQLMLSIIVTCFLMMGTQQFARKGPKNYQTDSSFCITKHIHIRLIDNDDVGILWLKYFEPPWI
jgi:hypothetical protein